MDVDLLPQSDSERPRRSAARLEDFLARAHGSVFYPLGRLPRQLHGGRSGIAALVAVSGMMEDMERRVIMDMLERTNWNQTDAAERFQIPLSTLNQKIKRLGIDTRRRGGPSADSTAHVAGK